MNERFETTNDSIADIRDGGANADQTVDNNLADNNGVDLNASEAQGVSMSKGEKRFSWTRGAAIGGAGIAVATGAVAELPHQENLHERGAPTEIRADSPYTLPASTDGQFLEQLRGEYPDARFAIPETEETKLNPVDEARNWSQNVQDGASEWADAKQREREMQAAQEAATAAERSQEEAGTKRI